MAVEPTADRPHPIPPQVFMPWKENWCFAGVDVEQRTAMVWHVSLRPRDGEGIFTCKLAGPDVAIRHVRRHPLTDDVAGAEQLGDGAVTFTVARPHERFDLRYEADGVTFGAAFTARFAPFDFADGPLAPGPSPIGELGRHVFPFHHYEQALSFEATLRRDGHPDLALAGFANRDHSWGWRDDFGFRSHHWICASFEDRYVQGSTMIDTTYPDRKHGGFVSDRTGNDPVAHVDVADAYWEEPPNEPFPDFDHDVTYRLTTVGGQRIEVTAHLAERFHVLHLNARHPDRSQVYVDAQIFCPYSLSTGERGAGLLEVGKHLRGEGIADRVGRRRAESEPTNRDGRDR